MLCVFDENLVCRSCGYKARRAGTLRQCVPALPPLAVRASNFAKSAARHIAAGMPQASEEEVGRRFAVCQACEHYDGSACSKCGCPVVREKLFLSKLSWATESCPVGKWGPVGPPDKTAVDTP